MAGSTYNKDSLTLNIGDVDTSLIITTEFSRLSDTFGFTYDNSIISVTPATITSGDAQTVSLTITALASGTTTLIWNYDSATYPSNPASVSITVAPSDYKVLVNNSSLQNIADAIRGKNGSSDTYLPSEMATAISNIPSDGTRYEENDVTFYDYDGTIVYSCSASDFAQASSLPNNPTHTGLTAQGWNWTLSDAKSYVATYGKLNIGQMYITDNGKTRIYIELQDGRLEPYVGIAVKGTATIEWGDGTSSTVTGTGTLSYNVVYTPHTYSSEGEYVISLSSNDVIYLWGDSGSNYLVGGGTPSSNMRYVYNNSIKKVELGNNIFCSNYAFSNATKLKTITFPNTEQQYIICQKMFLNCYDLKYVTIPPSTTIIDQTTLSGSGVLHISLPKTIADIRSSGFSGCRLKEIIIPNASLSAFNNYGFNNSIDLEYAVIPKLYSNSYNLFNNCYNLRECVIGTSVTLVPSALFTGCRSLSNVSFPSNITSVGTQAFNGCYGLKYVDFSNNTSVPTLANTNAFTNIPSDCKIIVPDDLYADWIAADNWSTYASYIVKASEYTG